MKVLVTGANGQLGQDVCKELKKRGLGYLGTTSAQMDITDAQAVHAVMDEYRPDAVIHCAAYTKVDQAEEEPERVFAVNEDGTRNLAIACKANHAKMLYLSTDYVFSGSESGCYEVDAPTAPCNIYGASKRRGELCIQENTGRFFIVRTSWIFSAHGSNFVRTMLQLSHQSDIVRVVKDQIGSPTYTADLAPLLSDMIKTDAYGTYHATNEGFCSWAEFAREIFQLARSDMTVIPISSTEYPSKAHRPMNSRLSKRSLDDSHFQRLPQWQDALARCIVQMKEETGNL